MSIASLFISFIKDMVRDVDVQGGETVVLGLRRRRGFFRVLKNTLSTRADYGPYHKLSDALEVAKVGQFNWTCIQLTNMHSYMEVDDKSTIGKVSNVSVGLGTVGSFSITIFYVLQMEVPACLMLERRSRVALEISHGF